MEIPSCRGGEFMTLLPGDVVMPEGVGAGMKPPQFLKRGDVVELEGVFSDRSGSAVV